MKIVKVIKISLRQYNALVDAGYTVVFVSKGDRMSPVERVKLSLEAIDGVREQLTAAAHAGDMERYRYLMDSLLMLECSLVHESRQLVEDLERQAA